MVQPSDVLRLPYRRLVLPDGQLVVAPLNYHDETSGVLVDAVVAFCCHPEPPVAEETLRLVRAYCEYVIHAPCWDANPYQNARHRRMLSRLRARVKRADTHEKLSAWISDCLEIGIDPL